MYDDLLSTLSGGTLEAEALASALQAITCTAGTPDDPQGLWDLCQDEAALLTTLLHVAGRDRMTTCSNGEIVAGARLNENKIRPALNMLAEKGYIALHTGEKKNERIIAINSLVAQPKPAGWKLGDLPRVSQKRSAKDVRVRAELVESVSAGRQEHRDRVLNEMFDSILCGHHLDEVLRAYATTVPANMQVSSAKFEQRVIAPLRTIEEWIARQPAKIEMDLRMILNGAIQLAHDKGISSYANDKGQENRFGGYVLTTVENDLKKVGCPEQAIRNGIILDEDCLSAERIDAARGVVSA